MVSMTAGELIATELIATLKKKHLDVLHLISEGKTAKQIAELRGYSEHTVKQYVKDIFTKLHVNNRVHAVAIYLRSKHEAEIARLRANKVSEFEGATLNQIIELRKELTQLSACIKEVGQSRTLARRS